MLMPAAAHAASSYTAGGGPWNVRYCPSTQCEVVGEMPNGDIPDLSCQTYGERVELGPQYMTNIWDKVRTPAGNVGYLTDAGVNETPGPTNFDPRLPRCSGDHGGSAYFKPRDWQPFDPDAHADVVIAMSRWSIGQCSSLNGGNYPDVIGNQRVTTLAGWSVARLAPIYAVQNNFDRVAASIDSIVLYDPGTWEEFFGEDSCDPYFRQSDLYAAWLGVRPTNRLLILAGRVTKDAGHPDSDGRLHQGIQQALFPKIRGTQLAQQVLVCNYDDLDHPAVLANFDDVVRLGPQSTCPTKPGVRLYASWHP